VFAKVACGQKRKSAGDGQRIWLADKD